jgi:hypothetical protein
VVDDEITLVIVFDVISLDDSTIAGVGVLLLSFFGERFVVDTVNERSSFVVPITVECCSREVTEVVEGSITKEDWIVESVSVV